jgi:predicted nucleic acid-binding protein
MENTVLVDAGPLIALFDKDDFYHKSIKRFVSANNFKFITTIAVITETSHMLDFNVQTQIDFLKWIDDKGIAIYEIQQKDIQRIIELSVKYSDIPMDFADATLVITAEQTGIRKIISVDSDFEIYRLPGKERIENIFNFRHFSP